MWRDTAFVFFEGEKMRYLMDVCDQKGIRVQVMVD